MFPERHSINTSFHFSQTAWQIVKWNKEQSKPLVKKLKQITIDLLNLPKPKFSSV